MDGFIDERLVEEVGIGQSTGGRRPKLLRIAASDNYIIGIDLGTTNIYGVLADLNASIIHEEKQPTRLEEGFYSIMEQTSEIIEKLSRQTAERKKRLCGIGMAVAGLINKSRNIVEFSPNFHWHDVDIVGNLSQKFSVPIYFDNVTRVMALGELCYGVGKQYKNFVFINVGYGIGAGIILDGQPLLGSVGMAGEFGHITVEKDSQTQCDCGNFGCLEALASGQGIARAARDELKKGTQSVLMEMCGGDLNKVTAEMVANAAKKGDALAWNVFSRAAEYIGLGISALINLFNPEAVVMGGGVIQAGEILFDNIRKTINARALNRSSRGVPLLPATFGLKAAAMGAVSLVMNKLLNLELECFLQKQKS
ncbi:MAG: putative ROK-family transcriptional regulator [Candidatus Saccharicenans subterraneus]|uniref:Putative ROK-family transcriptional regulator n=1 Tax=Candidatus Saccharicenans subterraneus TaxID=2508984 RepID=A0A3E2BKV7_9BACT|nr:MAG: putative ROK-family transcriptional regulator [Candidatus Saccharicenans subterraneum]